MGLTYQMKMKIPFDMADMNGHIKLPDVILLSLQVSGMQSINLGVSDKDVLEQYNLVWIITDYNMKIERLPVFDEKITIETYAKSHNRLFCYRAFNIKDEEGNTHWYVLHAEANAIMKVASSTQSSEGATLYITMSPCKECSKLIYQSE